MRWFFKITKTSFVFATGTLPDAPRRGINDRFIIMTHVSLYRVVPGRGESLQIYSALGDTSLPHMCKII